MGQDYDFASLLKITKNHRASEWLDKVIKMMAPLVLIVKCLLNEL